MKVNIHGDKIKVTSSMENYIIEKLHKLEKYIDNHESIIAKVIIKVQNYQQKVEITIPLKNFILRSEESTNDFYLTVDKVVEKLERQIVKNKKRLSSKKIKLSHEITFDVFDKNDFNNEENKIMKRKTIEIKPMNEEEAILQMELLGHQFYMFKNSDTNNIAVIYKRNDGNYGIISPE